MKAHNKKNWGEPCSTCGEDTLVTSIWSEDGNQLLGFEARCTNHWCYEPYVRTTLFEKLLNSEHLPDDIREGLKRTLETVSKRGNSKI